MNPFGPKHFLWCSCCKSLKVDRKYFEDELSWKEFHISGLCMACQNEVFKNPEKSENEKEKQIG
jgi:hypothetical protein